MQNISIKSYHNEGNRDVLNWLKKPGKVLDVGCGAGDNAKILKEHGFEVDGITISEIELKESLPYLNNGYIFNLENGLPIEVKSIQFDYIICSHVLEHICYPEKLLADIHNCLKRDGILIVALPNLFHYKSRWELLKGNFKYQPSGIWDNTHFKWYTYSTARDLLVTNGFNIRHQTVTGQLPFNSFFSKFLPKQLCLKLFKLLIKVSHGFFGYQLLYIANTK